MSFLFSDIIFGPIKSRRLGVSLGINLLPIDGKVCSFDCIYCECGYNTHGKDSGLPSREAVKNALDLKLKNMLTEGIVPDVFTFAGNGEPTMHNEFAEIVNDTIELRDKYFPHAKISVLSNSTYVRKESVFEALKKVDYNILKLDSGIDETIRQVDRPTQPSFTVAKIVEELQKFNGNLTIQTMFLRGTHNGKPVDNTTIQELNALIDAYKKINPKQIMVYSLDRETPENTLTKVSVKELHQIANLFTAQGFSVVVTG